MAKDTHLLGRRVAIVLVLGLILLAPASVSTAEQWHGKVIGIADGDTITVLHERRADKVRLNGIDAPEKGQPFGEQARQFMARLSFRQEVTVRVVGRDRHGRAIGDVLLPDGRSLSHQLVRARYAWWFRRYSSDETLRNLEGEARAARAGLWVDPIPVAPWEWRKEVLRNRNKDSGDESVGR